LIKDAEYVQKLRIDILLYNYTSANPFTSDSYLFVYLFILKS